MLARQQILDALQDVLDPELGLSVVELGLVYGVDVDEGRVHIRLTTTDPAGAQAEQLAGAAQARLARLEGLGPFAIDLVREPRWTPARMSARARAALGWGT